MGYLVKVVNRLSDQVTSLQKQLRSVNGGTSEEGAMWNKVDTSLALVHKSQAEQMEKIKLLADSMRDPLTLDEMEKKVAKFPLYVVAWRNGWSKEEA